MEFSVRLTTELPAMSPSRGIHMMTAHKNLLLTIALVGVAMVIDSAVQAGGKRTPAKRYRVIFNCDGHAVCKDAKGDLKQWIKNLFGPLEKSHVDALFWCDGAGGNTANYKSDVLELTGKRIGKPLPWIKKLLDEGHDPPKVVVREAKKRGIDVFYSFRFNDIHDSFMPSEMATFKVKHPEWMIGKQKYGNVTSYPSALNFAVPEVRELKFRVIEEIFQKYDFDGLEIDYLRALPYFLPGQEVKNGHLLTELLRRIRKHLNKRGRQRGRPIRLAVRVPESLEACRLDGLEIRKWIDQGLVDYLVLGGGVIDIQVEQFKKVAAPKGVLVYPCLYGWPSRYNPIPKELAAGLALNYWQQKADGLYLFNWFPHSHNNSERTGTYMAGLMQQLGDPKKIKANQQRLMFVADRGRPKGYYPHGWMHCVLPEAIPNGKSLRAQIRVSEQFANDVKVALQIEVKGLQADDVVTVTLNGQPVEKLKRIKADRLMGSVASGSLRAGFNETVMRLAKRSGKSAKPRTVTSLELHVTRSAQVRAKTGLFDQSQTSTLGLPTLKGEHKVIYKATKDGYKFCHHSNLVVFKDRLYAMWSNGKVGEDVNGQRILGCSTADGVNWTKPMVITADPDGPEGPRAAVAAGFHVHADTLTAYYTSIISGKQIDPRSTLYAITTRDGKSWGKPRKIATGFYIDGPRRMRDGRLLLNGQTSDRQPRLLFTDSPDGLSGWKPGVIPPNDIFSFPEPTWFQRSCGSLVMLFRTRSGHLRLYSSVSHDRGRTWSPPLETNIPDATARSFAGNLPDGTAFLISNPSTTPSATHPSIGRRTPLTIALSADGIIFDRAHVVRGEPTRMRFQGKSKLDGWQYPSALTWRGWLYIAYSINKEDVGVTRVRLKDLRRIVRRQKSP